MKRKDLFSEYVNNAVSHLHRTTGKPVAELEKKVRHYVETKMTSPDLAHMVRDSNGDFNKEILPLWKHTKRISDKVIAPCGSVYEPTVKHKSLLNQMVIDKLAERKLAKKKMLEAKAIGDNAEAQKYHHIQASIKITINSIIGAMGSSYNLFYDLPGFNSITSLARALIAYSYTATERNLAGNFGWFDVNSVVNHITSTLRTKPDDKKIINIINKFKLRYSNKEELLRSYEKDLNNNGYIGNVDQLEKVVSTLTDIEITYLFYYSNLKNVMQENQSLLNWVHDFLNTEPALRSDVEVDDIYKTDGDLMAVCMVFMAKQLGTQSPYDLPKNNPELAKLFVSMYKTLEEKLSSIQELFDMFIHVKEGIPQIRGKNKMYRNSVIVSDTDSEIFTAKQWAEWAVGDVVSITDKAYRMTGLVIYWVTKFTVAVLKNYSEIYGAFDEYNSVMKMKNEFLYPVMLTYDIKKTYCSIITIQEGKILPEPTVEIKGANLRSSEICEKTTKFIKGFLIDDVVKQSMKSKLTASELIKKTVHFERLIEDSILKNNDSSFLSMKSVNNKEKYPNPEITAYRYYEAWQEIFAWKYGDILLPTKCPKLPLMKVSKKYFDWLKEHHPKVHDKMYNYMKREKRMVPAFTLNPDAPAIPEELIPIIDVRSIIYSNLKPIYLTLRQLNITIGHKKKKLLFKDVYDVSPV